MKKKFEELFKDTRNALEDLVEFQHDAALTLFKSHLKATQIILDGYSHLVQDTLDHCDKPARKASEEKSSD